MKKTKAKEPTLSQIAAAQQAEKDAATANAMQNTIAGNIWTEIKDLNIEMFALPNQVVNMHCHPLFIHTEKLHLLTNSSAVLPSLEVAVGKKYVVELADKYVVVSRAPAK